MKETLVDFGLPEILKEDLEEAKYNHRIKYRNLYIRLIKRCQGMTEQELSGYNEKHHILPKCLGGGNEKENLVLMPVRYHIMAHVILAIIYPNIPGIRYSLMLITSTGDKNNQVLRKEGIKTFSTRFISSVREEAVNKLRILGKSKEHREKISKSLKGRKIPRDIVEKIASKLRGRKQSEELIRKRTASLKGLKRSEESRKRNSEAHKGIRLSEETKRKMSISTSGPKNPIYGTKRSEETKRKISEKNSGGKNGMAKKVIGPDGTIYSCISEASRITGLSKDQIGARINGKTKNSEGWSRYYNDNSQSD